MRSRLMTQALTWSHGMSLGLQNRVADRFGDDQKDFLSAVQDKLTSGHGVHIDPMLLIAMIGCLIAAIVIVLFMKKK
jgi:branched-subunit amino acid ABC-type transport system permease component